MNSDNIFAPAISTPLARIFLLLGVILYTVLRRLRY